MHAGFSAKGMVVHSTHREPYAFLLGQDWQLPKRVSAPRPWPEEPHSNDRRGAHFRLPKAGRIVVKFDHADVEPGENQQGL